MFRSHDQNAGQNYNIKTVVKKKNFFLSVNTNAWN